jgi:hypothetical protein
MARPDAGRRRDGCRQVVVTHGTVDCVVRTHREKGLDAEPLEAGFAADATAED